jgi:hypothetical protein
MESCRHCAVPAASWTQATWGDKVSGRYIRFLSFFFENQKKKFRFPQCSAHSIRAFSGCRIFGQ